MSMDLLRENRKKLKMTQKEAAKTLGISEQYYKQIEGGFDTPGLQLAIRMEKQFLVSPSNWERK